jgi:predicted transcriptional regulator
MSETNFERTINELQNRKDDIRPSDVILFSEPLRSALNFVIRLGRFSLTEFNEKLGFTREQARRVTELLIQRNLIVVSRFSTTEETYYESRLSALTRPLSRPSLDIWKKID